MAHSKKEPSKGFYNPGLKVMDKEQLEQFRESKMAELREVNRQAQKFTMKKELNLLDKQIINQRDMELTTVGFYDMPYHCDLYMIA